MKTSSCSAPPSRAATRWRCSSSKRKTRSRISSANRKRDCAAAWKICFRTAATAIVTGLTRTRKRVKSSAFRAYNIFYGLLQGFALRNDGKAGLFQCIALRNAEQTESFQCVRVHVIAKFQKKPPQSMLQWEYVLRSLRALRSNPFFDKSKFAGLFQCIALRNDEKTESFQCVRVHVIAKFQKKPPQSYDFQGTLIDSGI